MSVHTAAIVVVAMTFVMYAAFVSNLAALIGKDLLTQIPSSHHMSGMSGFSLLSWPPPA